MSTTLTNNDYIKILNFYKMKIPKSSRLLKKQADKILNDKLCRCIKNIDPINESRSIGICTKTVLNDKGLRRGKFSCTGKKQLTYKRSVGKGLARTKRRINKFI